MAASVLGILASAMLDPVDVAATIPGGVVVSAKVTDNVNNLDVFLENVLSNNKNERERVGKHSYHFR